MLPLKPMRAGFALAIAVLTIPVLTASADIPPDPTSAALEAKSSSVRDGIHSGSRTTEAKRIVRPDEEGLGQIAADIHHRLPSDRSGAGQPRGKIYSPVNPRQAKTLIRRPPPGSAGSGLPTPGALPLAALGVLLVLRLKRSYGCGIRD